MMRNPAHPPRPDFPPEMPRAKTVPLHRDNLELFAAKIRVGKTKTWPRLSETLRWPRHPDHCQNCGRSRFALGAEGAYLVAWQECAQDGKDTPEDIYLMLCTLCDKATGKKGMVAQHPRFYRQLPTNVPQPGIMGLCAGCAWRDGTHCSHPDKPQNGGAGLVIEQPKPNAFHVKGDRTTTGWYRAYEPATACSGREEIEAIADLHTGLHTGTETR